MMKNILKKLIPIVLGPIVPLGLFFHISKKRKIKNKNKVFIERADGGKNCVFFNRRKVLKPGELYLIMDPVTLKSRVLYLKDFGKTSYYLPDQKKEVESNLFCGLFSTSKINRAAKHEIISLQHVLGKARVCSKR